jgi:cation transporter-like permease
MVMVPTIHDTKTDCTGTGRAKPELKGRLEPELLAVSQAYVIPSVQKLTLYVVAQLVEDNTYLSAVMPVHQSFAAGMCIRSSARPSTLSHMEQESTSRSLGCP